MSVTTGTSVESLKKLAMGVDVIYADSIDSTVTKILLDKIVKSTMNQDELASLLSGNKTATEKLLESLKNEEKVKGVEVKVSKNGLKINEVINLSEVHKPIKGFLHDSQASPSKVEDQETSQKKVNSNLKAHSSKSEMMLGRLDENPSIKLGDSRSEARKQLDQQIERLNQQESELKQLKSNILDNQKKVEEKIMAKPLEDIKAIRIPINKEVFGNQKLADNSSNLNLVISQPKPQDKMILVIPQSAQNNTSVINSPSINNNLLRSSIQDSQNSLNSLNQHPQVNSLNLSANENNLVNPKKQNGEDEEEFVDDLDIESFIHLGEKPISHNIKSKRAQGVINVSIADQLRSNFKVKTLDEIKDTAKDTYSQLTEESPTNNSNLKSLELNAYQLDEKFQEIKSELLMTLMSS